MLRGLDYAFAYIDDVLIASHDESEHEQHVHAVLKRLQDFVMLINPAKCVFGVFAVTSLTFLGHVINKDGCQPNPDRVDTIHRWPFPATKKGLQRFLGSVNFYRRFIPNVAEIQTTLYNLVAQVKNKYRPLQWNDSTHSAFDTCHTALAATANLAHPKPNAELRLSTSIGTVIEQRNGNDWQPLGFFSRKLTDAETRYSTYDRELLAAYSSTRYFIYLIEGHLITLFTDHKPLTFMFTHKSEKYVDRQVRQI